MCIHILFRLEDQRGRRSYLGETVLIDWADGATTSVGLVKYCRMAQRDGNNLPMIEKFAACGSADYHNSASDLKALLEAAGSTLNIVELTGPIYKFGILPSSVIKLIARSEQQFKLRLAPSADEIQLFWEEFFSSEAGIAYKNLHPHLRTLTTAQLRTMFPIVIHQDSAPFTKNSSTDVISWSSMFGRGAENVTKCQAIETSMWFCLLAVAPPQTEKIICIATAISLRNSAF